jgi:hypothetical protein
LRERTYDLDAAIRRTQQGSNPWQYLRDIQDA